MCDLERHRPLDLLPDRSAELLTDWLARHPGVKIISRDRSGVYAKGASAGAPHARQVADRFHLLKNLRKALVRLLTRLPRELKDAVAAGAAALARPHISPVITESVPRTTGLNIVGTSGSELYGSIPRTGEFSIINWTGYPAGVPRPVGPFRILSGAEYAEARAAANAANAAIREELPLWSNAGLEWHEIQPVKFGGSPTDLANKIPLPAGFHRSQVTPWWNAFQRGMGGN